MEFFLLIAIKININVFNALNTNFNNKEHIKLMILNLRQSFLILTTKNIFLFTLHISFEKNCISQNINLILYIITITLYTFFLINL